MQTTVFLETQGTGKAFTLKETNADFQEQMIIYLGFLLNNNVALIACEAKSIPRLILSKVKEAMDNLTLWKPSS